MSTVKTPAQPAGQAASPKARPVRKPAWQAAFPTKKAYDESVASVVARIKSGEVQPRVPDEAVVGLAHADFSYEGEDRCSTHLLL